MNFKIVVQYFAFGSNCYAVKGLVEPVDEIQKCETSCESD